MHQADTADVVAARTGHAPKEVKLRLYRFARTLVAKKGRVTEEESQVLLRAGYSRAQ
jgi:hypothetical protein